MLRNHKQQFHDEIRNRNDLRIMSDSELKRVQNEYMEMAADLFEMCDSCGIYATLSGGSVLGAVRHHGFIPWDDDMDINIPRKDFEKMKTAFDDYFQGKYTFSAPNHNPHSGYRCGKIENPRVKVWDETGRRHGLTIDVFIIENVPDSKTFRFLRGLRSEMYRIIAGLVFEYECSKNEGNLKAKVPMRRKICYLAGFLFSFRGSAKWYDILDQVNQFNNEQTEMVSIPSGRKHYFGEIYKREWMTEAVLLPFEDRMFPAPKGFDDYLRQLYGNYKMLPPVDQREYHYIHAIEFQSK